MPPPPLARTMADRAVALLDTLDRRQRAATTLPFDSPERHEWAYWPRRRRGVPLHELSRAGTKAVHRLLASALSPPAFARAVAIEALDEVLDLAEGYEGAPRHRDDYSAVVYGKPGDDVWAWRFEGHHVSVHATITGDEVQLTPLFLGANPAAVLDGDRPVLAPLAAEEELGFELLAALSLDQRADAVLDDKAPEDILSRNDAQVDGSLVADDAGVPLASLRGGAARTAGALLDLYLRRLAEGARRPHPDGVRFAWAGADEPGIGHYYRLAGPRLLIELDNTQDEANHVHTVVRDPAYDFGDPLAEHHRRAHR